VSPDPGDAQELISEIRAIRVRVQKAGELIAASVLVAKGILPRSLRVEFGQIVF